VRWVLLEHEVAPASACDLQRGSRSCWVRGFDGRPPPRIRARAIPSSPCCALHCSNIGSATVPERGGVDVRGKWGAREGARDCPSAEIRVDSSAAKRRTSDAGGSLTITSRRGSDLPTRAPIRRAPHPWRRIRRPPKRACKAARRETQPPCPDGCRAAARRRAPRRSRGSPPSPDRSPDRGPWW
jgi:hypothetical protein